MSDGISELYLWFHLTSNEFPCEVMSHREKVRYFVTLILIIMLEENVTSPTCISFVLAEVDAMYLEGILITLLLCRITNKQFDF